MDSIPTIPNSFALGKRIIYWAGPNGIKELHGEKGIIVFNKQFVIVSFDEQFYGITYNCRGLCPNKTGLAFFNTKDPTAPDSIFRLQILESRNDFEIVNEMIEIYNSKDNEEEAKTKLFELAKNIVEEKYNRYKRIEINDFY